jgi:hypothetical protein
MAGYQDQLVPFNPYIQQIPVDDYVRVGMIKQQQYDQGVQKVQGYIDSVAGLDVAKTEQKNYLNQRIGQLQSQVSKIASQDFSNQQVVSSVGHLTKELASDPIIQNSVYSTQALRAQDAKMKQAQDQGKSSISNEFVYQRSRSRWLNDGDVKSTFNAEYTPYTDYKGKMIKALNETLGKPDEVLTQNPYKRDGRGNIITDDHGQPIIDYAMLQETFKGVSADRIKNVVESSMDENDRRQMGIDGQYEYRAYGKPELKQLTDRSYQSRLDQINSAIQGLGIERNKNVDNPQHIADVDSQINKLKSQAEKLKTSYLADIGNLDQDPEGYKSSLYAQNWLSKFSEGYSYSQHSLKFVDNPFFNAAQKELENNIKFEEFKLNKYYDAQRLGLEQQRIDAMTDKNEIEKLKAGIKSKFDKPGAGGGVTLSGISVPTPIPGDTKELTEADWLNNIDATKKDVEAKGMALLASMPETTGLVTIQDGGDPTKSRYEWNVQGKSPEEANAIIAQGKAALLSLKDGDETGNVTPQVKNYFDAVRLADWSTKNSMAAIQTARERADKQPDLNVNSLLSKVTPLSLRSTSGASYSYSPSEMVEFNRNLVSVLKREATGGGRAPNLGRVYYDNEAASKIFVSPKDKFLYSIITKPEDQRTAADKQIISKLHNVYDTVNAPGADILKNRDKYISDLLQQVRGVKQPVQTDLSQFTGADKAKANTLANDVFANITAFKKSNPNVNYDEDKIADMLRGKYAPNTKFGLVDYGNKNYALRYMNTDVSKTPIDITLTPQQVNNVFGGQLGTDQFEAINEALNLSKLSNRLTTDVTNQGVKSALKVSSGGLHNYTAKYHVEGLNGTPGYQIRFYVHNKTTNADQEVVMNPGDLLNSAQILTVVNNLTDQSIQQMLNPKKSNTSLQ